ncbi:MULTISPECIES: FtsK/SpoIIIE domain-containing protein [unclassified Pseudonocardia]|uniref:FtsK/SpoIIIE domain-containing protein n=3 Tax=Pseudonocardia TaxID=1847 RepID=UPI00094B740A|nr:MULTISPECIES: FtsK/SpoIIIE domain-containing protein [unclassified Pseudonocardia]OLL69933.1 plasmid transfer protein [Pseudonocardia sp. Ae263_Ps1]
MGFWTARQERALDEREVDALWWAWRQACEGAGLCTRVDTVTGPTVTVPRLVDVVLGPPVVLTVQLLPGQLLGDLRRLALRIAPHLGAVALRVTALGQIHARIELLGADPLDGTVGLVLPAAPGRVLLGRDETARDLAQSWADDVAHTIVQGVTRSGKSVFTYGLLAQLAADPLVTLCGSDPTGLLWRPFTGTRHAAWQVSGVDDPAAHEALLLVLVEDMDARISSMPADRDTVEITPAQPLRVVVLEELAALYRTADAASTTKDPIGKRIRALIGRLLAEGAKAGYRLVLIVQRAEAAIVGAFERAMCSLRISFRTDNRASVELLHPGAPAELADQHTVACPGVALLSAPGEELTRFRAPYLGGYPEYVAAVRSACPPEETGPAAVAA